MEAAIHGMCSGDFFVTDKGSVVKNFAGRTTLWPARQIDRVELVTIERHSAVQVFHVDKGCINATVGTLEECERAFAMFADRL